MVQVVVDQHLQFWNYYLTRVLSLLDSRVFTGGPRYPVNVYRLTPTFSNFCDFLDTNLYVMITFWYL